MDNQELLNRYTYRITWSEDDQEFVGLCAEFPGLSWLNKDRNKALDGIFDVVSSALQILKEDGDTIPEPISTRKFSGKFIVRIPKETHRSLALAAAEEGVSLNQLAATRLSK